MKELKQYNKLLLSLLDSSVVKERVRALQREIQLLERIVELQEKR